MSKARQQGAAFLDAMDNAALDDFTRQTFGYRASDLEGLLKIGSKLRRGGTIGESDMKLLCSAHPMIPEHMVREAAKMVNDAPPGSRAEFFVSQVTGTSGDGEAVQSGLRLLDAYDTEDAVHAINQKSGIEDTRLADVATPPPRYAKTDTRSAIEDAMGITAKREAIERLPEDVVRNKLADKMDAATERLANSEDDTRRGTVEAAFELHSVESVSREEGYLPEASE